MGNYQSALIRTSKIAIHTQSGISVIDQNEIVYCQGDGRYTKINLRNGEIILVAKLLRSFEITLDKAYFYRIHKSFLININYIKKIKTSKNPKIILENKIELSIAKRRKADFLNSFSNKIMSV